MNERHEIVRLRDEEGLTERAIARRLELPTTTVHYWLAKELVPPPPQPPKRGRQRVTSAGLDAEIRSWSLEYPFDTAVDIRRQLAPQVSVDTVRKRLKEQGLRCRIPARKPFLTDDHVKGRLTFANRHFNWGIAEWEKVFFTDEKIFRSASKGPLRVYRPQESHRYDKPYLVPSSNEKGNFTINVWLGFSKEHRNLHLVRDKTLTAAYYIEKILEPLADVLKSKGWTYMQDQASVHTAKAVRLWFQNNNIPLLDWPPKGPDMNPVENVWAELVRRVRNNPTNRDQLFENVHAAFVELTDDYFDTLIASMPKRMALVQAAAGGWTKY